MSQLASHLTHYPQACDGKVHMGQHEAKLAARRMAEFHGEPFQAYPCIRHRGRHWCVGSASWETAPKAGR